MNELRRTKEKKTQTELNNILEFCNNNSEVPVELSKIMIHSIPSDFITDFSNECKKKQWTSIEDQQLKAAIELIGTDSWGSVAKLVPTRNPRQCKNRWIHMNYKPKNNFSQWEDDIIISMQKKIGNKWKIISNLVDNKTPNEVMIRWKNHLSSLNLTNHIHTNII